MLLRRKQEPQAPITGRSPSDGRQTKAASPGILLSRDILWEINSARPRIWLVGFLNHPMAVIYVDNDHWDHESFALKTYCDSLRAHGFTTIHGFGVPEAKLRALAASDRWKRGNLKVRERKLAKLL